MMSLDSISNDMMCFFRSSSTWFSIPFLLCSLNMKPLMTSSVLSFSLLKLAEMLGNSLMFSPVLRIFAILSKRGPCISGMILLSALRMNASPIWSLKTTSLYELVQEKGRMYPPRMILSVISSSSLSGSFSLETFIFSSSSTSASSFGTRYKGAGGLMFSFCICFFNAKYSSQFFSERDSVFWLISSAMNLRKPRDA